MPWLPAHAAGSRSAALSRRPLPEEEPGLGRARLSPPGRELPDPREQPLPGERRAQPTCGPAGSGQVGGGDRDRDKGSGQGHGHASPPGSVSFPLRLGRPGHSGAGRGGWVRAAASSAGLLWFSSRSFLRRLLSPKRGAMTSLAEQLKRLALPQNDPSLLDRSEVASLLFTCKEAATIDRDTFFAIGEFVCLVATGFKNTPKNSWRKINRKDKSVFRKGKRIVPKAAG